MRRAIWVGVVLVLLGCTDPFGGTQIHRDRQQGPAVPGPQGGTLNESQLNETQVESMERRTTTSTGQPSAGTTVEGSAALKEESAAATAVSKSDGTLSSPSRVEHVTARTLRSVGRKTTIEEGNKTAAHLAVKPEPHPIPNVFREEGAVTTERSAAEPP